LNQNLFGLGIIDVWLVFHFFSGLALFWFFNRFKSRKFNKNRILWLVFGILIFSELVEQVLFDAGLAIREPFINTILDVIVSMAGAFYISKRV